MVSLIHSQGDLTVELDSAGPIIISQEGDRVILDTQSDLPWLIRKLAELSEAQKFVEACCEELVDASSHRDEGR